MLALGVDERVLEASRMSQTLLEETAAACGGTCLHGFAEVHRAFRSLSSPLPASTPTKASPTGALSLIPSKSCIADDRLARLSACHATEFPATHFCMHVLR